VAGNIVCFDRDDKRLVGYWLGREFWGQGLATRALAELLVEVTERPLYAYVAKTNIGSARVLEKCGFELTDHRIRHEELGEVEEDLYVLKA
jgi:RimJ/RimL family protein N-acetyltransferase